jgi:hypothetical protein
MSWRKLMAGGRLPVENADGLVELHQAVLFH